MKNFIKIFIVSLSVIAFAGCSKDKLNLKNESQYNYTEYFTTPQSILQATNATYAVLNNNGMWPREYYYDFDLLGFDVKKGPNLLGSYMQMAAWEHDGTHTEIGQLWSSLYRMIARANLTEDRGQNLLNVLTNATDIANIQRYIAEVKVLRAYARYHVAMLWGDAPLRKGMNSYKENFPGRAPVDSLWKEAENDLKDAIAVLPVTYDNNNIGRATKGAATALLGRVYLYQKKWLDAQNTLTPLLTAPYNYTLLTDWDKLFDDVAANSGNSETVFQVMNRTWIPNDWAAGNGWSYAFGAAESGGRISLSIRANEYDFMGWNNTIMTTDAAMAFKYPINTTASYIDPRAALTFYGDSTIGLGAKKFAEKTATPKLFAFGTKGYQLRKYGLNFKYTADVPFMPGVNGQIIRFSDVLLMLAEAHIQQNNIGSVPLALINQVRARVGAEAYLSLGGDKASAMAIIERERRLEFTGEQQRYFDLIRWGKYVAAINAARIAEGLPGNVQAKHILLPIPNVEKDFNATVASQVRDGWN